MTTSDEIESRLQHSQEEIFLQITIINPCLVLYALSLKECNVIKSIKYLIYIDLMSCTRSSSFVGDEEKNKCKLF
jgi:hypothetical protein